MSEATNTSRLGRNSLVYGGALLVPRLASFAALIIFSRLLTPAEYGYFALFIISCDLINSVMFGWIRLAFLRMLPEYEQNERVGALRRNCLAFTALAIAASFVVAAVLGAFAAPERWLAFFAFVAMNSFANGAIQLRLAELQGTERAPAYFMIEGSRAALALALSLAFVLGLGETFECLAGGFVAANTALALVCLFPYRGDLARLAIERVHAREIISYAGPIVPVNMLESLIPLSERMVILMLAGPAGVGVYAAAQNLVRQPINMIFSAIVLAGFPIVMRSAENRDSSFARAHLKQLGAFLFAVGVPALAGIIALRTEIAGVVLGENFREGAVAIMPWIAVTAVLMNFKFHYVDLAFHIAKRMKTYLYTLLPATLLTVPLIYVFMGLWGLPGAAAGSCLAVATSLAASIVIGRRVFRTEHPWGDIGRILVCAGAMVGVLALVKPLGGPAGLIVLVASGAATYGALAVLLNVIGLRDTVLPRLAHLKEAWSRAS